MQLVCLTCGRKIRMPDRRLKDDPPCGSRMIRFAAKGHRKVRIRDLAALGAVVRGSLSTATLP